MKGVTEIKINKLDLIIYTKSGKLSRVLYLIASLIILIPISIVLITDVPFSSTFTNISIGVSYIFVIIGKILTILNKKKGDKDLPVDVAILIGILTAFIQFILKQI